MLGVFTDVALAWITANLSDSLPALVHRRAAPSGSQVRAGALLRHAGVEPPHSSEFLMPATTRRSIARARGEFGRGIWRLARCLSHRSVPVPERRDLQHVEPLLHGVGQLVPKTLLLSA